MSIVLASVFVWLLWMTSGIQPMSYTEKLLSFVCIVIISDWIENKRGKTCSNCQK